MVKEKVTRNMQATQEKVGTRALSARIKTQNCTTQPYLSRYEITNRNKSISWKGTEKMHNRLLVRISNIAKAINSDDHDIEAIEIEDLTENDWNDIANLVHETPAVPGQPNKKQKKTRTKYWRQRYKRLLAIYNQMLNDRAIEEEEAPPSCY